ncbi:MAG: hypothetical protein RBS55_11580, partial [Bacteroidales bacterium]|nr:hypothetical protein [Bacteroidales bacterium]
MKKFTSFLRINRRLRIRSIIILSLCLSGIYGFSQALTQEFTNAGYTLTDLGSINLLPPQYGGLTIRPEQPNTLYIGGDANASGGAIYTVPLVREAGTNHITGFGGDATLFVLAPNNDGGLFFAPNGTLLFTQYSQNHLGQILPDNTYISTSLTEYGIASSVGSIVLVPSGYPGAGNLILASYNGHIFYKVPYTIDGSAQYILSNQTAQVSVSGLANGPEGIAYIPAGSLGFPNLSMAVSAYGDGTVMVFEVGAEGLPDITTARQMVTGLTGAEGALIDPLTGDFLFSTFGGGNKIIRITGFEKPSAIGDNTAGMIAVNLYPNPTSGIVSFEVSRPENEG